MTYGQWPGQDGEQGQPAQQGWPGGGGVVPPQWRRERQDGTRQLAWYGQPGYDQHGPQAGGSGRRQPPEPRSGRHRLERGNGQQGYEPQQPQPQFLPPWPAQPGRQGSGPSSPQPPSGPQPPRGKSWPARHKALIGVLAFVALAIIIAAANSGRSPSSPGGGTKADLTTTASPTATGTPGNQAAQTAAAAQRTQPEKTQPAAPATSDVPAPSHTTAPSAQAPAPSAPAPTTAAATAPPAATSAAPAGCHPLTNAGNCYEPGEYCRDSDHGVSGVTEDGEPITCENNDGWRWEPS
jgi:hypothetical protein